jgi:hypothetical protein
MVFVEDSWLYGADYQSQDKDELVRVSLLHTAFGLKQ